MMRMAAFLAMSELLSCRDAPHEPRPASLPSSHGPKARKQSGSRPCVCGRTISANKDSCLRCHEARFKAA